MTQEFRLGNAWRIITHELGLDTEALLRRASLPLDLLVRTEDVVTTEQYFGLWEALVEETGDPHIGLQLGQMVSVDMFDPAIFAALCSPNLDTASLRLSKYKRLIGPFTLDVDVGSATTSLTYGCFDRPDVHRSLVDTELTFLVHFVRLATRHPVVPRSVSMVSPPGQRSSYRAYFGVPVEEGLSNTLVFSREDAQRRFMTANAPMWEVFEPHLRRRLHECDASASTEQRVRAVLLEQLPSGVSSLDAVAKALGMSTRSMQRRLRDEQTSFQKVLGHVREELARHYLGHSELSSAEIGFLLGYDDPNSFFRAFHQWTGRTPESARASLRAPKPRPTP